MDLEDPARRVDDNADDVVNRAVDTTSALPQRNPRSEADCPELPPSKVEPDDVVNRAVDTPSALGRQDPPSEADCPELPPSRLEPEGEEVSVLAELHHDGDGPPSSLSNRGIPSVTFERDAGKEPDVAAALKLKNNLVWAVGFLELANAGDFAANVWNTIPVPIYAVVLMAIGGTLAGVMSIFALRDARASWRNVQFLRRQRRILREGKKRACCRLELGESGDDGVDKEYQQPEAPGDIDVLLDVCYRELGTELINRFGMDILLGSGAVLIAAGTFMAIDGANPRVWKASNLLSGYIGNAPITAYGLVNSAWAFYIFRMAGHHQAAAARVLQRGRPAMALLRRRVRNVQIYAGINGMATLLGGVGSMITATRWWGYIILLPVIFSSIFCNFWFRRHVGYDRPYLATRSLRMTTDDLVSAMESAAALHHAIRDSPRALLDSLIAPDSASLSTLLNFLVENDLLETFCLRLLRDTHLKAGLPSLLDPCTPELRISVPALLVVPENHQAIIRVAEECFRRDGPEHFKSRERYIAEVLGSHLSLGQVKHECG